LCGDRGLSAVPAAGVLSMMGIFDLVGTTLSGYLSDRYDNRKLLLGYYGLRGLSLLWLPYSSFTLVGLSVFAMFYGLDWIATVPPTVKLAAAEFGKERAGLVFGWVFAAHQLGAATAAYGAGLTRTLLLTYDPALFAAGAACLVAAVGVLGIRRQGAPAPALATARG
ncbi:MAG TPA: MFS transporter, partial [Ramlibacter sp.]